MNVLVLFVAVWKRSHGLVEDSVAKTLGLGIWTIF